MVELLNHRLGIWLSLAVILRIYIKTLCVAGISYVRLDGRANLTVIQSLPVNAVEKWMRFDLLGTTADVS